MLAVVGRCDLCRVVRVQAHPQSSGGWARTGVRATWVSPDDSAAVDLRGGSRAGRAIGPPLARRSRRPACHQQRIPSCRTLIRLLEGPVHGDAVGLRRPHRTAVHLMPVVQLADRALLDPRIASDRGEQLHPSLITVEWGPFTPSQPPRRVGRWGQVGGSQRRPARCRARSPGPLRGLRQHCRGRPP